MNATVEIIGPAGARQIPIGQLYLLPGSTPQLEFTLQPGELITAIEVPTTPMGRASTYHKIRDRESFAFALASAAVALTMSGSQVAAVRIAVGGVATIPWRATEAEQALTGQTLTSTSAYNAGRAAFQSATPGAHNGFKIELGARTIADALMIAAKRS
jgi:xanthine dehydrogenase YagS FAD-binding subunit